MAIGNSEVMDKLPANKLEFYYDEDETAIALETSYVDELTLNDQYTHEERMELAAMYQRTVTIPRLYHEKATLLIKYDYWISPITLSAKEFVMLSEPLENMPLYMNDDSMDKQTIAMWRLKCAK